MTWHMTLAKKAEWREMFQWATPEELAKLAKPTRKKKRRKVKK